MSQFRPYAISHIQLTSLKKIDQPKVNALLYFWWKAIPLGHLWVDSKNEWTDTVFKKRIADSIFTAARYYIGGNANEVYRRISFYIKQERFSALESCLERHLSRSLFRSSSEHRSSPISVVICTRNRPQQIETCIQSLLQSSDKNFELIVVDNNPDNDLTEKVVAKYAGVRYILEPRKGLDIARNTGAKAASCSIVAYTDDDVVIDKDWVRNIKCCFTNPKTMAVTGLVMPVALDEWSQYVFERHWGFNKGYKPTTFDRNFFNKHRDVGVPVWCLIWWGSLMSGWTLALQVVAEIRNSGIVYWQKDGIANTTRNLWPIISTEKVPKLYIVRYSTTCVARLRLYWYNMKITDMMETGTV